MNRLSPKNSVTKTWTGHSLYKTSLFSIKFFVCKTGCLSPCRFFDMIIKIDIIVYKTFEALSKVLKVSPFPLPPLSSKTGCFKNKIRFNFVCLPLLKRKETGSLNFPEMCMWSWHIEFCAWKGFKAPSNALKLSAPFPLPPDMFKNRLFLKNQLPLQFDIFYLSRISGK